MIVEMRRDDSSQEMDDVVQRAKSLGLGVQLNLGTDKTVVALLGSNTGQLPTDVFAVLPGVQRVAGIMRPYKLSSREFKPQNNRGPGQRDQDRGSVYCGHGRTLRHRERGTA